MYKDRGGMWVNIELGNLLESALSAVGITSERVERFVGAPCGCVERREKLNRLGAWAKRILTGKKDDASKYLEEILETEFPNQQQPKPIKDLGKGSVQLS